MFFRLYTAADTYTDYDKVWDVNIAPQEIAGATYWQQECRSASFSMPYETVFEPYWNDEAKPPIYRLIGELWERYTYADQNGEIHNHEVRLFRGWLFQDSFLIETVGITAAAVHRILTITLKDYLSVLQYCMTNAFTITDSTGTANYINLTETLLPYDSAVSIEGIYQDIWNQVPCSATDTAYPLWTIPALENTLETYPGYGYTYNGVLIFTQQDIPLGVDKAEARIYQDDDGRVIFEEVRLRWASPFFTYRYHYEFNRYYVDGSRLTLQEGYPVILRGWFGTVLADQDFGYVTTVLTGRDWESNYPEHTLAIVVNGNTITYSVVDGALFESGFEYRKELRVTGSVNYTYFYTLPEPDNAQTEAATETDWLSWTRYLQIYNAQEGWFPAWHKPTTEDGIKGWTVSTPSLFSFALLVNFAWLRESGDSYQIANRLWLSEGMEIQNLTGTKVINYTDRHEFNIEQYNGGVDCLLDNAAYVEGINNFASRIYKQINRACEFSCNQQVTVGDYVVLPYVGSGYPIQITSASYDPAQPALWHYTGRSF